MYALYFQDTEPYRRADDLLFTAKDGFVDVRRLRYLNFCVKPADLIRINNPVQVVYIIMYMYQTEDASWPQDVENVYWFLLVVLVFASNLISKGTAVLVRSLQMKSRKTLACDLFDTSACLALLMM